MNAYMYYVCGWCDILTAISTTINPIGIVEYLLKKEKKIVRNRRQKGQKEKETNEK